MIYRLRPLALTLTALCGLTLTACATSGTGNKNTDDVSPAAAGAVGDSCEPYGDITMTVGFSEASESIGAGFAKLVEEFEAANTNVTIDLQAKEWASSQQTIRLVMSGDDPPDVMQGNEGWSIDGALWQAGLIANLDAYAELYGWVEEFPESALTVNRFSADGTVLGEGNLVAVPQAIQYVGVFYNKDVLAELGVDDVSVLDDQGKFMETIQAAKDAGRVPVVLGNSEKWPMLHNLSLFNGWYDEPDVIDAWVFNTPGATYDTPGRLKGSQDLVDWAEKGYFNADSQALTLADATARFVEGDSPFFITGTWSLGDVYAGLGDKAGFMLWPTNADGLHRAVGGYSLPFTMSTKTEYPDCAAAFIDFVTASQAAIDAQIEAGRPSATKAGAEAQVDNPMLAQMIAEYERLNADDGLFTWEDWPTPTMGNLMMSEAQRLYVGEITPQQYNTTIQENWDEYMATR
ncbi:MAG: extracellular solute-binding protein [Bifidobacteriaceae bacterium]|jgi:raffinose/stachyose/melibiose transport system substrate-binding protein|nr:extracellular solute-binding protein [Bifidobacteriaceae bacterium]